MVLISVIIPCHNQKQRIPPLIDSLEKQTLDKDRFEVIIADGGSTDGSADLIRKYRGNLDLMPVLLNENAGRAGTRNAAIRQARGKYILFLDGDMMAHEDLLNIHLQALRMGESRVYLGKVEPGEGFQQDPFHWYRISRGAQKCKPGESLPPKYFVTNNSSMPRDLLKKAGPFNASYRTWGGEDLEMGYQLQKQGATFFLLPQARSFHYHPETLDDYIKKIKNYAQYGLKLLIKNCPAHARRGYLYWFTACAPASQLLLSVFFSRIIYFFMTTFVTFIRIRPWAYRVYDYITYYHIYSHLRK
jgi:glycosyltransferase involved in cell wall biosynthesis